LLASLALLSLTGCVAHPRGPHGPSCAAIEAAAKIDLSSHRLIVLRNIAGRPELSQHEQTYLVNAICFAGVGGEHADALVALIQNPCCTAETRQYISKNLLFVMYSNERRRVAEELSKADRQAATQPAP
jgi:hypothetical protein